MAQPSALAPGPLNALNPQKPEQQGLLSDGEIEEGEGRISTVLSPHHYAIQYLHCATNLYMHATWLYTNALILVHLQMISIVTQSN